MNIDRPLLAKRLILDVELGVTKLNECFLNRKNKDGTAINNRSLVKGLFYCPKEEI